MSKLIAIVEFYAFLIINTQFFSTKKFMINILYITKYTFAFILKENLLSTSINLTLEVFVPVSFALNN